MMMDRGNSDAGCVEMKIGGQQLVHGGKNRDRVFGLGIRSAVRVGLNGCCQSHAQAGGFQFAVDAEMVAAKCAGSDNGNAHNRFAGYFFAPLPSTASRQRL